MLTIQSRLLDRVKNLKAVSAGALAFGVGLTGAAVYVGSSMVYDNFSYDIADKNGSSQVAGAMTEAEIKAANGQSGIPGSRNGNSPWPSTAATDQNSGSAGVNISPASGSAGTTPIIGGMGGTDTTPTVITPSTPNPVLPPLPVDPITPTPEPTLPVVDPLLNTVQDALEVNVGVGL